jgi:hypothetical protein
VRRAGCCSRPSGARTGTARRHECPLLQTVHADMTTLSFTFDRDRDRHGVGLRPRSDAGCPRRVEGPFAAARRAAVGGRGHHARRVRDLLPVCCSSVRACCCGASFSCST